MNVKPWVICPKCNAPLTVENKDYENYFNNEIKICDRCNEQIDWWLTILKTIKINLMSNQVFSTLGLPSKIITIKIKANEKIKLKFADHDIPTTARILYVNYTPQGGSLFPIEIHGNIPYRRSPLNEITLFPVPISNDVDVLDSTEVSVFVTWINEQTEEAPLLNLVDAFEAYSLKNYTDPIVPANIAVEFKINYILTEILTRVINKRKKVDDFLTSAATYSYQLNIILPLITNLKNIPPLSKDIIGLLDRLRRLRNQIAHTGKTENEITKNDIAELLSAAVFGYYYTLFIEKNYL